MLQAVHPVPDRFNRVILQVNDLYKTVPVGLNLFYVGFTLFGRTLDRLRPE